MQNLRKNKIGFVYFCIQANLQLSLLKFNKKLRLIRIMQNLHIYFCVWVNIQSTNQHLIFFVDILFL